MSNSEICKTDLKEGVLTITLNRPKVNAFNNALISATQAAFEHARRDEKVRCVVLTGAGNVFSAGQDLTAFERISSAPYRNHLQRTYNPLILQIRRLEKPVLAAINGIVSGAALGLVLACDLRIVADHARFMVGFCGVGLAPDSAVSLLLPALIGLGRAAEFTYINEPIQAEQALTWGLANRVVPGDDLLEIATAWAAQLALGPIASMGLAKRAFNKAVLGNLEQVLDYESHLQEIAGLGVEHREGMQAFLEKREPKFQ